MADHTLFTLIKQLAALLILALLLALVPARPGLALDSQRQMMLVNKSHVLAADDVPDDLVKLSDYLPAGSSVKMTRAAAEALGKMAAAMKEAGIDDVYGASGYRSYAVQSSLYQQKTSYYRNLGYGRDQAAALAGTIVAPPGASEHQTGLAIDLVSWENGGSMDEDFGSTQAGKWLAINCWRYGFILRYAADKTELTGYIFEPWHFRYVGREHAKYMTEHHLCLEEYTQLIKERGALISDAEGNNYAVYYTDQPEQADPAISRLSLAYAGDTAAYIVTLHTVDTDLSDLIAYWGKERIQKLMLLSVVAGYADFSPAPGGQPLLTKELTREGLTRLIETFEPQRDQAPGLEAALVQGELSPAICYLNPLG